MKKHMFLLVIICLFTSENMIAQVDTQLTADYLQTLYNKGEYKKVISYFDQIQGVNDAAALMILGDCCWKQSYIEETQSNQIYQQTLALQTNCISQGIYFDTSLSIFLYQQAQQYVMKLRLQSVDLYSKAKQLGDETGAQRLSYINSILGIYNQSYSNSSNTSSPVDSSQRKCTYCNGSGKCYFCNSAGQSKACVENMFGVTCSDNYCIAKNHKCRDCSGTHICQNCKGSGTR